MAQSSRSSSTMNSQNNVLCQCNRPAKIVQAWTDKNPGRRFYTCRGRKVGTEYEQCNFFEWFDLEKPSGWQTVALLEARDVIKRQKEESRRLKDMVSSIENRDGSMDIIQLTTKMEELELKLKQPCEKCELVKREVLILTERSTIYRNVLITSSIGFTVAIGVILAISKH